MYTIREIFKTLQGEGGNAGRVAVFCRFAGCNLWSGRERDRGDAVCRFCDTDFVGGESYGATELAQAIAGVWGESLWKRMVVLTGGEPCLQYDKALFEALRVHGFYIAVETNGTVPLRAHADWVCVSPKAGTVLCQRDADELKVVYPQDFDVLRIPVVARIKSVQPMDGPDREANTRAAIAFCMANPEWRLSLQTHKFVGLR